MDGAMKGIRHSSVYSTLGRGLTLIELMITLVILSISVLVVTPAMQTLLQDNRLQTEAGRLMATMNLARSEAVSRNMPVSLCPSVMADSGVPICGGQYADGWIVFSNANRDRVVDPNSDELIQASAGIPGGYTLTNRAGTRAATELLTFMPDGSTGQNGTLLLCPPQLSPVESRAVVLNMVGRARIGKGEGQCPPAVI
jgi:type IV fimbrial biogenesis protein FimT